MFVGPDQDDPGYGQSTFAGPDMDDRGYRLSTFVGPDQDDRGYRQRLFLVYALPEVNSSNQIYVQ